MIDAIMLNAKIALWVLSLVLLMLSVYLAASVFLYMLHNARKSFTKNKEGKTHARRDSDFRRAKEYSNKRAASGNRGRDRRGSGYVNPGSQSNPKGYSNPRAEHRNIISDPK